MTDFKDQVDKTEAETVGKLVTELREIAAKGQSGDASVTADQIREAINKTQQASLTLFSKVYEKKNAEEAAKNAAPEADSASTEGEKKN